MLYSASTSGFRRVSLAETAAKKKDTEDGVLVAVTPVALQLHSGLLAMQDLDEEEPGLTHSMFQRLLRSHLARMQNPPFTAVLPKSVPTDLRNPIF